MDPFSSSVSSDPILQFHPLLCSSITVAAFPNQLLPSTLNNTDLPLLTSFIQVIVLTLLPTPSKPHVNKPFCLVRFRSRLTTNPHLSFFPDPISHSHGQFCSRIPAVLSPFPFEQAPTNPNDFLLQTSFSQPLSIF